MPHSNMVIPIVSGAPVVVIAPPLTKQKRSRKFRVAFVDHMGCAYEAVAHGENGIGLYKALCHSNLVKNVMIEEPEIS